MGSVYQRASDGRWVAALSHGPRGARKYTTRYADTKEGAEALVAQMGGQLRPPLPAERFWPKVAKGDGCWEWRGFRIRAGSYGVFWDGERRIIASRFAYRDAVGLIPAGRYVLHRCDNPPCVRPDHLFLGTLADNTRDMAAKGRASYQKRAARTAVPVRVTTLATANRSAGP